MKGETQKQRTHFTLYSLLFTFHVSLDSARLAAF